MLIYFRMENPNIPVEIIATIYKSNVLVRIVAREFCYLKSVSIAVNNTTFKKPFGPEDIDLQKMLVTFKCLFEPVKFCRKLQFGLDPNLSAMTMSLSTLLSTRKLIQKDFQRYFIHFSKTIVVPSGFQVTRRYLPSHLAAKNKQFAFAICSHNYDFRL